MEPIGLRERKKERTRRHIADSAARLFAERGYEQVAVGDVARKAEVAEQTVYNYFPTKEQLVIDRDQRVRDRLCELIRSRPAATSSWNRSPTFVASLASSGAASWAISRRSARPSTGWRWR